MVSLFSLIHYFGVLRDGFRCHFGVFWKPWGHFFLIYEGIGSRLEF